MATLCWPAVLAPAARTTFHLRDYTREWLHKKVATQESGYTRVVIREWLQGRKGSCTRYRPEQLEHESTNIVAEDLVSCVVGNDVPWICGVHEKISRQKGQYSVRFATTKASTTTQNNDPSSERKLQRCRRLGRSKFKRHGRYGYGYRSNTNQT